MATSSIEIESANTRTNSNPFADYGGIVYGSGFIGRDYEQMILRHRIIDANDPGCLSVVGAPRIGKSSFAFHTLVYPRVELNKLKLVTVRLNLPNFETLAQLLRKLVSTVAADLQELGLRDEGLHKAADSVAIEGLPWIELQDRVQRFFKGVKRQGWRVVCIIDEFDSARVLFRDDPGAFQLLRELAYEPEWRICFVTISRRPLCEIESQSQSDISNFHGIFHDLYLRPFDTADLSRLIAKLEGTGLSIDEELQRFVYLNTGGHPFLSSALCFCIAKTWLDENDRAFDKMLNEATIELTKYYDKLISILRESELLDKLLQILLGPVTDVTRLDAEQFERYGLIRPDESGYFSAFSDHFGDYIRLLERSTDLWTLWRDTERKLRLLIAKKMEEKFATQNWIPELEKTNPDIKKIFDKARLTQSNDKAIFGSRASNNLLDYMYPWNLTMIIYKHWPLFEDILGNDREYWSVRFNLLEKLRNPMAHSREDAIEPYQYQIADGYCRELLHLLKTALH